jgi:hypothetical protein
VLHTTLARRATTHSHPARFAGRPHSLHASHLQCGAPAGSQLRLAGGPPY